MIRRLLIGVALLGNSCVGPGGRERTPLATVARSRAVSGRVVADVNGLRRVGKPPSWLRSTSVPATNWRRENPSRLGGGVPDGFVDDVRVDVRQALTKRTTARSWSPSLRRNPPSRGADLGE